MIVDILMINNTIVLYIHKKFFKNQTFPLVAFQGESPLMDSYSQYGTFAIGEGSFGFDRCFKIHENSQDYDIFSFKRINDKVERRKMMLTIYFITDYVVEQMFYYKEFLEDGIWGDQTLSFIIFNGGQMQNGYSIGGKLYPWFKKRLALLSAEQLGELNTFVKSSLDEFSLIIQGRELHYSQITIENNSFFIVVDSGGRWIHWSGSKDIGDRCGEFSSHNIDFSSDQELCFAAVVLINTWLRTNVADV